MNFGGSVRINPLGLLVLTLGALLIIYFNFGHRTNPNHLTDPGPRVVSMKSLLAASIEIAKRGGYEVKRIRNEIDIGEKSKGKTAEGANNPVTNGDMLSHKAMYNGLLKTFPGLSVISEESDPQPVDMDTIPIVSLQNEEVDRIVGDKDYSVPIEDVAVWIDPLDATQEYTENLLQYVTTMVCVAVKGQPTVGVIHKPFEARTAWGWAGPDLVGDAVKEDIEATFGKSDYRQHKDLSRAKIIVSRSHAGSVHDVAGSAFGRDVAVTPAGGAGFKSWEVAAGKQDAYVHVTLIKKWDICAGDALLGALGGHLTDLRGREIDYSADPDRVKAESGVLATLHDHYVFLEKLEPALKT